MVIPVYILPVMAVIFFTAGGVTARKRKTELEIPDKRKKISCILFLLFLVFTVLSIVILPIEGQFYGEPVKILSTTLDKNDVMVLYDQPADTKNLSLAKDDTFLTDAQSTERIRYKDVLYNTNTIKRKDVFSVTKSEDVGQKNIFISQCIVKEKALCFWKVSACYRITVSED